MNEIFPWLQQSWQPFSHYLKQNRIPQALLVMGKKGMGKQQLVDVFSQSLLCMDTLENGLYCGKCQSCTLFKVGTHPDYSMVEPEEKGKAIGIAVIRQLTSKLALKPQFDGHRIVVLNPADALNNASANAFLKYLEEPTERTSLVLITDKPFQLPATIRSRCQKLFIAEPDPVLVKDWLKQQDITENLELILKLSQGAPFVATEIAKGDTLTLRSESFKQWIKLQTTDAGLLALAEKWSKLEPNGLNELLFWMMSWVEDMIKLAYEPQTKHLINIDLVTHLQETVNKLDLKLLYKYHDVLLLNQKKLTTQLNKQLMFEENLIQWSELKSK